jgi:lysophospholipid acyltransferase (LPLAT)-like uncharacterized protein
MTIITRINSWMVAGLVALLRATCRIDFHNDPRPRLRAAGTNYVYAFLHAHQLSIIIGSEPNTAAMVSRSRDGQLVVPALRLAGCVVFRGSKKSNNRARGGMQAIDSLIHHVRTRGPAAIAVDGPRGPRGKVHKGIAMVSQNSGAAILLVAARPKRRWVARSAWDRMQIPLPFTRIEGQFAEPIFPQEGEKLEAFRQRIHTQMSILERRIDPSEAVFSKTSAESEPREAETVAQTAEIRPAA